MLLYVLQEWVIVRFILRVRESMKAGLGDGVERAVSTRKSYGRTCQPSGMYCHKDALKI